MCRTCDLIYALRSFRFQKPYCCKVPNCTKRYTDPSSLRKHVKSHTHEDQLLCKLKKDPSTPQPSSSPALAAPGPAATPLTWATASRQSTTGTPTNGSFHLGGGGGGGGTSSSSSTLLSAGLQAGGTVMNVEEVNSASSPGLIDDNSPLHQIVLGHSETGGETHLDGVIKRGKFSHNEWGQFFQNLSI